MRELMQELYASGVEMTIAPVGAALEIRFFHRGLRVGHTYAMSSCGLSDDVTMSMEKYVRLLLDGFLKEIAEIRRNGVYEVCG